MNEYSASDDNKWKYLGIDADPPNGKIQVLTMGGMSIVGTKNTIGIVAWAHLAKRDKTKEAFQKQYAYNFELMKQVPNGWTTPTLEKDNLLEAFETKMMESGTKPGDDTLSRAPGNTMYTNAFTEAMYQGYKLGVSVQNDKANRCDPKRHIGTGMVQYFVDQLQSIVIRIDIGEAEAARILVAALKTANAFPVICPTPVKNSAADLAVQMEFLSTRAAHHLGCGKEGCTFCKNFKPSK